LSQSFRGMMNCQDMNSLCASNFVNDSVIAVDNLPNFVRSPHFRNHTSNSWIGLRYEVMFKSLSIVREAYFIES